MVPLRAGADLLHRSGRRRDLCDPDLLPVQRARCLLLLRPAGSHRHGDLVGGGARRLEVHRQRARHPAAVRRTAGPRQFAPVPGMAPCEVALCAGPLVTDWHGDGGGGHVAMTVRRRRSLGGADGVAGLGTFGELSRRAIEQYERLLGVPARSRSSIWVLLCLDFLHEKCPRLPLFILYTL